MKAFATTISGDCEIEYPSEWSFLNDDITEKEKNASDLLDEYCQYHHSFQRRFKYYTIRWATENIFAINARDNPEKTLDKNERKKKKLIEAKNLFEKLLPTLIREHKGEYVAIVDGHVEIGPDKKRLLDHVVRKYGYTSMYFDQILEEKKTIRMSNRPRVR